MFEEREKEEGRKQGKQGGGRKQEKEAKRKEGKKGQKSGYFPEDEWPWSLGALSMVRRDSGMLPESFFMSQVFIIYHLHLGD